MQYWLNQLTAKPGPFMDVLGKYCCHSTHRLGLSGTRALGDACLVHARITGDHVLLTCRVPSDKKGTQSSIYSTHSGTLHACQCLWRHVTSSGTPLLPEERDARDWTGHWLAFHAPRHRPASRPVRRLSRSGRIPAGNLARIDPAVTGSCSGGAASPPW